MSVTWDRRRPSWIRAAQEKALGRYMGRVVYPYSPFYRARFGDDFIDYLVAIKESEVNRFQKAVGAEMPETVSPWEQSEYFELF